MSPVEAFLLGIGLAMDALAATIAIGAVKRQYFTWRHIATVAAFFGLFQFAMPIIGWYGGSLCGEIATRYGRYAATALLIFIGGKMIVEALRRRGDDEAKQSCPAHQGFRLWRLATLAFATSIDALLVGVGYACLQRPPVAVLGDAAIIGVVTAAICAAGGILVRLCGCILGGKCEIAGGLVLIAIAVKTLIWG